MKKVFIDGGAGTTGLKIVDRLSNREDIELIRLDEQYRKDTACRAKAMNSSDIVFLCLPDDIARQAVTLVENPDTVIIDTSTAHRTSPDWTYGFAELGNNRQAIAKSKRIANPGCHASGFIALVYPLVEKGILPPDINLTCFSVTGYSGGGKKMIAQYQENPDDILLSAPRMYGISQQHKHLPEMAKICGLKNDPVFCPIVSNFYSGMEVTVSLFANEIKATSDQIKQVYSSYYTKGCVGFCDDSAEEGFLSAAAFSGRDDMQISVYGNERRIILVSRFDNLGKGASGSAIQNMNIVMGVPENTGLIV